MADNDSDSESDQIEELNFEGADEIPVQNTVKKDVQYAAESIKTYNVETNKFFVPTVIDGKPTEHKADPDDVTIQTQINQIKLNEALYCKRELQNLKDKKAFNATQISVQNHAIDFKKLIWKMLADVPNIAQTDTHISKLADVKLNKRVSKKLKSKNNVDNENDENECFTVDYGPFWEAMEAEDITPIQNILVDYISKACNAEIGQSAKSIILLKTSKKRSALKTSYILPFDRLCHQAASDAVAKLTKDQDFLKLDSAFSMARTAIIKAINHTFSETWSQNPIAPWDDTQIKTPVLNVTEMKQSEPELMIPAAWKRFTNEQHFRIVVNELEWVRKNLEEMREHQNEVINID